jgi:recombination protein RecR
MRLKTCSICFNETSEDPCAICGDARRDKDLIAVVEKPFVIPPLESFGFEGHYHVLHGVISPRDGIGPDQLRIRELVDRVWDYGINELILCLPNSQEGNATAMTIQQYLISAGLPGIRLTNSLRL